jgi:hypothetical protein
LTLAGTGVGREEEIRRIWEEFHRIKDALAASADGRTEQVYTEPDKPRDGDGPLYADGVHWNPDGNGKGLFFRSGNGWVRIFTGSDEDLAVLLEKVTEWVTDLLP